MTKRSDDTAGSVPSWASILRTRGVGVVRRDARRRARRRGVPHRIDMETGCIHVDRQGDAPNILGLSNLLQICPRSSRARPGPAPSHAHFDVAFDVKDGATAEQLAKDWTLARERVKLRLYVRSNLPDVPLVTWELAEGLVAVLTFDLPETVISVRLEDSRAVGRHRRRPLRFSRSRTSAAKGSSPPPTSISAIARR